MQLFTSTDIADITGAMGDLWDTFQKEVTIVKEPSVTIVDMSGPYIPGYGLTSQESNVTPTTESQTFYCLTVEKKPENYSNQTTTKTETKQEVFLKVQLSAKNYIEDGRKNLHAIYEGRKYNISSESEAAHLLTATYYIYKLELIT